MNNREKILDMLEGNGTPKICVPITGRSQKEILKMAGEIYKSDADLAEWRVDYYEDFQDIDEVNHTLSLIKEILDRKPLLFTFRTSYEGGQESISYNEYSALLYGAAVNADLADIEVYYPGDTKKLISTVKEYCVVVGSYHNFNKTPGTDEIINRLEYISSAGADIPKIAVMPQSRLDVIRLMEASLIAKERLGGRPVITISMSGTGLVTRTAAESTGSVITFGCTGKQSAPGQIEASVLKKMIDILHCHQERK